MGALGHLALIHIALLQKVLSSDTRQWKQYVHAQTRPLPLDSKLGTNATASILNVTDDPNATARKAKQAILAQDKRLRLQVAAQHQSVKLAVPP